MNLSRIIERCHHTAAEVFCSPIKEKRASAVRCIVTRLPSDDSCFLVLLCLFNHRIEPHDTDSLRAIAPAIILGQVLQHVGLLASSPGSFGFISAQAFRTVRQAPS